MRGAVLPLAVLLAGCASDTEHLQTDIQRLQGEVAQLEKETRQLRRTLRRARQAVEQPEKVELPPNFDPDRPLPESAPDRPDVIVLSIDTLRADHLGAWGYERETSPFLDHLAREGTRFASAWSPSPWTLPSHATMLTGRLPRSHGAIEDHVRIPDTVPMVQEHFREAGYATGAVVATLFVSSRFGFDRGFDFFYDFGIVDARVNNAGTVDAEHVFAWALSWAQAQDPGTPIFLFLHVYDVHYGYDAPEPWNTLFDRAPTLGDPVYRNYYHYLQHPLTDEQMAHQVAQYDEEIAYVDHSFKQFLEQWTATRSDVLVAVTSDHGEEFGERGSWGHAHTLFPEQLHVPLILWGPGAKAQVIEDRVGLEDLGPTLASLARVPFAATDGVDRAAQVRTGRPPAHDGVPARFAETSRFTTLQYRWHQPPYDLYLDLQHDRRMLCRLDHDPACAEDLSRAEPDQAHTLTAQMMEWLGDAWEAREPGRVTVEDGRIYQGTSLVRFPHLAVSAGDRFSVHPLDAVVRFEPQSGEVSGPWRIIGGDAPEAEAPLRYLGEVDAAIPVDLSDEEREMLQALGYIQE